jgi:hypothetical protein
MSMVREWKLHVISVHNAISCPVVNALIAVWWQWQHTACQRVSEKICTATPWQIRGSRASNEFHLRQGLLLQAFPQNSTCTSYSLKREERPILFGLESQCNDRMFHSRWSWPRKSSDSASSLRFPKEQDWRGVYRLLDAIVHWPTC